MEKQCVVYEVNTNFSIVSCLLLLLLLLLLQSALQPLWVLASSTIVQYSQQEDFYRVPLPAARQNPQTGGDSKSIKRNLKDNAQFGGDVSYPAGNLVAVEIYLKGFIYNLLSGTSCSIVEKFRI